MMPPLISVIIPVYNTAKFLSRCLDSILNQDYQSLEVILINDGSTDNSLEICREYEARDERIRVFTQKNSGQSVARNHGLRMARGEYISFIDSDDYIGERTYSSAIDLLDNCRDCDMVQYPVYHGKANQEAVLVLQDRPAVIGTEQMLHSCLVDQAISWIVCDKVIRRSVLSGLSFLEGVRYEDNLFLFELLLRSRGICFSTKGYYYYYWNDQSTTHSSSPKAGLWEDMLEIHKRIYQLVRNAAPNSAAQAIALYIIVNDVFVAYRMNKWKKNAISSAAISTLRQASIKSFLFTPDLDLKKRGKMLAMKLWAHIASE